jgi:putative ABC transport system permease protein
MRLAAALDQAFLDARRPPAQVITRTMIRDSLDEHFQVVGGVVRMAALTAVLVGALVLAATAAFNVIDRRREVGILRALGARPPRILAILCIEALSIVLLGVSVAVGLSLVLSRALLGAAERTLLRVDVPMQFSYEGLALLGAGAMLIVAAVAIVLAFMLRKPARESLAQL